MKILVSSCLLGENVRYDGTNNKISSKLFELILNNNEIFSFCPEVEGGLQTPRVPAEVVNTRVLTKEGIDVTNFFIKGAKQALALCKKEGITVALLKAKSPSCGNSKIYDGSFSSLLIKGSGITTKLLNQNGIKVFNEEELESLNKLLNHH